MEQRGDHGDPGTTPASIERSLPSGRTLVVRVGAGGEELEVRDREGALELSIVLTDDRPLGRVRAARIALESADDVSVRCRRFEVEAVEAVRLRSEGEVRVGAGEVRVRAGGDIKKGGGTDRR